MIYYPENNPDLLYFLAKKRKNNLLVIGLHPGTINAEHSDPTISNMDNLTRRNGYDGWLLVNLYPRRISDPVYLDLTEEKEIFWYNLHVIKLLLDRNLFKIKDACLSWGDNIDLVKRPYLKQAARCLYRELLSNDLNYFSIGRTRRANPRPIPPLTNFKDPFEHLELLKFDYKHYLRNVKLEPEITINGVKFG